MGQVRIPPPKTRNVPERDGKLAPKTCQTHETIEKMCTNYHSMGVTAVGLGNPATETEQTSPDARQLPNPPSMDLEKDPCLWVLVAVVLGAKIALYKRYKQNKRNF